MRDWNSTYNSRKRAGITLAGLVIGISVIGPLPRQVSLGPISLAGAISAAIPLISLGLIILSKRIKVSVLRRIWPLALLVAVMWAQTVIQLNSNAPRFENTPFIVTGILLLFLAMASTNSTISDISFIRTFHRGGLAFTLVLALIALTRDQDPATSQIAVIFLPFLILKVMRHTDYRALCLAGVIILAVFALESRIVVLALFSEVAVLMFILRNRYPHRVNLGLTLLLLVGALALFFLDFTSLAGRAGGDGAFVLNGIEIDTAGRIYYWNLVLESWQDNPIFGDGHSVSVEMFDINRWKHPHNDYLRLLHMTGLVGLFLWIIFWLKIILPLYLKESADPDRRALNAKAEINLAALASTIGVSVLMITDNTLTYSYVVYPWALLVGRTTNSAA